jgi:D-glycero-D-manno-heptose 1,7-bisphosphate phosphatase
MVAKALFLDRDGIICKALGRYLLSWDEFELSPGIGELITAAKEKGYKIIIVTNQPQISKGLLAEDALASIHKKMQTSLEDSVDAVFYCSHQDTDGCLCRKPKPGMLLQAVKKFGIDLHRSIMVGDSYRDVGAGKRAGCTMVLVPNVFTENFMMSESLLMW